MAESVHGLLRDVMGWASPRTLILLLETDLPESVHV